nr:hypothetical protein [Tanacetum cinerariifolium]
MGNEINVGCWYALLVIICALLSPTTNAYGRDHKCDLYQGSWVYDESYPMYDSTKCPHIRREYDCVKYGRPNLDYLKFRWQPSHCSLPRLMKSCWCMGACKLVT